MVISYSIEQLNTIGEMVILRECAARTHEPIAAIQRPVQRAYPYTQMYGLQMGGGQHSSNANNNNNYNSHGYIGNSLHNHISSSNSANSLIQDFAQIQQQINSAAAFGQHQAAQLGADWLAHQQNQCNTYQRHVGGPPQLTNSVADFFKKAQQNFKPPASIDATKARRLSEIEAELIASRCNAA